MYTLCCAIRFPVRQPGFRAGFRVDSGPKPYEFIGFADLHGPKPYEFIGFGDLHGPKPYEFIGFGDHLCIPYVARYCFRSGNRASVPDFGWILAWKT